MSENENIDIYEFEEDNFFQPGLISIDEEQLDDEKVCNSGSMKQLTARHRIEDYFEARRLREQITDPIYYL